MDHGIEALRKVGVRYLEIGAGGHGSRRCAEALRAIR